MECDGIFSTYTPETTDMNGNTINAVNANSNTCSCDSSNIDGEIYEFEAPEVYNGLSAYSEDYVVEHPDGSFWVFCCSTGKCQSKTSCTGDDHGFDADSEVECDLADAVKGLFAALGIMLLVIIVVIVLIVVLIIYCCCCKGGNKTAAA